MARTVDTLVIHHSATPSGTVEEFRRKHKVLGFSDIGYHTVIGNGHGVADGDIALGRPEHLKGAGVWGNNTGKLHVCLIGNLEETEPTANQWHSLGLWLLTRTNNWKTPKVGLPKIVGHKEIALPGHGTLCPGKNMRLDLVRKWFESAWHLYDSGQAFEGLDAYVERKLRPTPGPIDRSSSAGKGLGNPIQVLVEVAGIMQSGVPNRIFEPKAALVDGEAFVRLRDIAENLRWGMPSWDAGTRTVTIKTRRGT